MRYAYMQKHMQEEHVGDGKKAVCASERERETWTTSSTPLASVKIRLFLISRTLATRKTASALLLSSVCPVCKFFLSNFPYCFRALSFIAVEGAFPLARSGSSYFAKMFGLYSMAHINWKQSILCLKMSY